MTYRVRRVAVLGAGTMGAGIAAHAANAGLSVDLLDVAPAELTPEEASKGLSLDSPAVRNRIVQAGFTRLRKARPPALMADSLAGHIRPGNFADDFERLRDADWIVEAVVENLAVKRELMERIEDVRAPAAIVSSNTSGLPLAQIAAGRSPAFRRHFLGTHFFNPPRYMKLLEIIPTAETDPELVAFMVDFARRVLGKGVVLAKDTPNFIANRIASFSGMQKVRYALDNGYSIEEVDALTGPLIGHPKTATFRLADLVGLDVKLNVAENLYQLVPQDEARETLRVPEPLDRMRRAGLLGNKTGGGFYRRTQRDGRTVFDVLDLDSLTYRPAQPVETAALNEAWRHADLGERLRFLLSRAETDRAARLIRDTLLPALSYAACRVPEISDSPAEVDRAMEWGYAQEAGPFRTWDLLGVAPTVGQMDALGLAVAPWVRTMLERGNTSFYRPENGRELVYSPVRERYEPVRGDPEGIDLAQLRRSGGEMSGNASASLIDLGDGVLCLEIHSPNSVWDSGVREMTRRAVEELESDSWLGLVVANQAENFCVGADLREIATLAAGNDVEATRQAVKAAQDLLLSLRLASRPVVAAVQGQTLGGGAELAMQADRVVAAAETYMGLVETRVGLLPAGGGCKELLRRVVSPPLSVPGTPYLPFLQKAFEMVALAKVSSSALEAREMGLLAESDAIVMNRDHVLAVARDQVLEMAPDYRPPPQDSVYASGAPGLAALQVAIRQTQWAGFATDDDGVIAEQVAAVLCGGRLSVPQWAPAEYILRLEREAFAALLATEGTQTRIKSFLATGKPART